jgi:hypothetical protein
MKRLVVYVLGMAAVLAGPLVAADDKKADAPKDPYAEVFSFPSKITLDEKQQEKLAELRKRYEEALTSFDKTLELSGGDVETSAFKKQLIRLITRKKNALLTDAQKDALNIKVFIPAYAEEKALNDPKRWDLDQLEKLFVVQSRSYDPEEQVVSFLVLTKRKWTDMERQRDGRLWQSGRDLSPAVEAIFYDKNEAKIMGFTSRWWFQGIMRAEAKLTDKQEQEGLLRFRIKIDLAQYWDSVKNAASVKLVYPEPR